ncbi:hypothetical protein [Streptomyces sp. WMMB 322]|uniref:hypothetical protein n=1 Tax=Streptomyces sp. WMMB 322 TaxID=1286821 RepID=UPI0006E16BA7|nr:hypothetical protein [Streptomyces sp. WMMB 322]SCK49106.1 hypothetical protein H180DRAFT_04408 [Streptomyces sp. WMMB 322]
MGELLPYLVVAGVLAAVVGFFTWLAAVVRRRGVAGSAVRGALAAHDEAFHVTAHDSAYEIRAQAERKVPVVEPGCGTGGTGRRPFVPRPRARRRWRLRKGGPRGR